MTSQILEVLKKVKVTNYQTIGVRIKPIDEKIFYIIYIMPKTFDAKQQFLGVKFEDLKQLEIDLQAINFNVGSIYWNEYGLEITTFKL